MSALKQFSKQPDRPMNRFLKIRQAWDDKLIFPFSELPKRYIGGKLNVLLKLKCNICGNRDVFACVSSREFFEVGRCEQVKADSDNDQFLVFVDSIHVVNDPDWIVKRVEAVIRLRLLDQEQCLGVGDSLYFSTVLGKFVFVDGFFAEDRKLNTPGMILSMLGARELPRDVIQARSKMVNDLSGENGEVRINRLFLEIRTCFHDRVKILITPDWVFASLKETRYLDLKIEDILVGPFELFVDPC